MAMNLAIDPELPRQGTAGEWGKDEEGGSDQGASGVHCTPRAEKIAGALRQVQCNPDFDYKKERSRS